MSHEMPVERFFETLISGDRGAAREFVRRERARGTSPETLITDLFWPTYQLLERLHSSDQLECLSHHLATRLLRVLVDQNAAGLGRDAERGRTIFAFCGPDDADDLGAQMAVDLLERAGYDITFAGGGIANDEILARVNETKPGILLAFCSAPRDLPNIRELIDTLHEIGACPGLQIAVGGGVFNRAEGLAEEIGADTWAKSPMELVDCLVGNPQKRAEAEQRTVGRNRRKRSAA